MILTLTITGDTATSVVLTAMTRTDTGLTPAGVTLPAAFTDAGGGVWTYTFTEETTGLTYEYLALVTWSDGSTETVTRAQAGTVGYVGRYTTESDLRLFMETENVDAYSPTTGGVQQAIDAAESEVDSILATGPYAVPLVFAGNVVDPIFRMHVNALAAWWINAKRPITQQQAPGVSYSTVRRNAMRAMNAYRMGIRTLAGATAGTAQTQPQSIAPTVDADGFPVYTSNNPAPVQPWAYGWGYGFGGGW